MKIITIFPFFASLLPATIDVAACGTPQNSTVGERRRLNLDGLSRLGDNGNGDDVTFNDTMVSNCMALDYTVNLVILEHIYLFFQAGPDAQSNNGCQSILIHATSSNMTMAKEAFIVPTNSLAGLNGEDDSTPNGIIDFGTYPLHDILTSYEDASPFGVGHEDESYHYIYNNCGDLLVNFLENLGHVSSPFEAEIIAELLAYVAPNFVSSARESVNGTEQANWTDEQLMYWLVNMRAEKMYAGKNVTNSVPN